MSLRVAVLSLTRDRLEYTRHCFTTLKERAGCYYEHYVLDQGSTDGTAEWLRGNEAAGLGIEAFLGSQNVGINRGMNFLRQALALQAHSLDAFDVYVKFDNDCELLHDDTLRICCELALDGDAILSPRILGLNNPPAPAGEFTIHDETIVDIPQIGGIFMAVPAHIYERFSYSDTELLHSLDDVELCWWWRGQGGRCGYVKRLEANHYETTSGQHERFPEYFQRTLAEGKASL